MVPTERHDMCDSGTIVRWEIGVDTGGTFTDCIATASGMPTRRAKVLSSSALRARVVGGCGGRLEVSLPLARTPEFACALLPGFRLGSNAGPRVCAVALSDAGALLLHCESEPGTNPHAFVDLVSPWEAPILATRVALERPGAMSLRDCRICIGTTRGTNALLEGETTPTLLVVNEGLEDILRIGDQRRLDIFALAPSKPRRIEQLAIGVTARLSPDDRVIEALDESALRRASRIAIKRGLRAAAVALLHAAFGPNGSAIERRIGEILREEGFTAVTLSHSCGGSSRFEPRAKCALVDASLSGPVGEFVRSIERSAEGAQLFMMTSAGGLTPLRAFHPRESLLSGPAGGVSAAARIAARHGFTKCITLDMGGTSADVARVEGSAELRDETTVGSATLASPSVAIESVAAGGGSILWCDAGTLRVGPRSAGAAPGPACYGGGGPLTLTDANLLLGRIDQTRMPIPLDEAAAERRAEEVRAALRNHGRKLSRTAMLEAFVDLADEAMASAIRTVTIRRGHDPSEHTLVAFGGSGALHACSIAERLGISTILHPHDAGLMCASGIACAPLSRVVTSLELAPLGIDCARRVRLAVRAARTELVSIGAHPNRPPKIRAAVLVRIAGNDESIEIPVPSGHRSGAGLAAHLRALFAERFAQTYGYPPPATASLELERVRVVAEAGRAPRARGAAARLALSKHSGPCCVTDAHSSAFVASGWTASRQRDGALVMIRTATHQRARTADSVELLAAQLSAIAVDMGEQLRRTAISPNIKDRLDFSCGLLDASGRLLVNAPHIPIHLGALGVCVRAVSEAHPLSSGDTVIVNHPRLGGSHLPDVTAITPIFDGEQTLLGFAANRAHHAEIGGTRPGSMPPDATRLEEEGCVLEPTTVVDRGVDRFDRLEHLLRHARWPSRLIHDNLMDVRAQVAANALATAALPRLVAGHPSGALNACCEALRRESAAAASRAIAALPFDNAHAEERLDDGSLLRVALSRSPDGQRLVIDFTGSAAQHPRNLNAPAAVTRAAVMYTIRVLVGDQLGSDGPAFPLNEGLLDPVRIVIPERSILSPDFTGPPELCPACAIGQTETSQRLVDLLWRALAMAACSQGTINNLLFGNAKFGFYETIAGGAGATERVCGESGVHTHISNTRITDAEVLERRYGVRLERFRVREGSGGGGERRGGDGLIRRIRFNEPVELSFLSQHRVEEPYGLAGGHAGARGAQRILRSDGTAEELPGIAAAALHAGDAIEIETPGGGGHGAPRTA